MTTTKKVLTKKAETKRLASIPERSYYESYIPRQMSGSKTEFDVYDYALSTNTNVLIEGPTGLGKTSSVLAYAAKEQRAFYAIPSNVGIEPSQLFGKMIPDGAGSFEWVDGPVTDLVRNGGVLLINEVNFIPERVATVLFGLLDKRRQITLLDHKAETIDAHPDLVIIADMNPEYEGTRPLNKAFRNRFGIQLVWDYDKNTESILVKSEHLLRLAEQIRAAAEYETPVATNMLVEFEQIAVSPLGVEFAMENFISHFEISERESIRLMWNALFANVVDDLFTDEDADDTDSRYPPNHPIWERRRTAPDGYVDPEWGVKGETWVLGPDDDDQPDDDGNTAPF